MGAVSSCNICSVGGEKVYKSRIYIALGFMVILAVSFWSLSRYPALFKDLKHSESGTLVHQQIGSITKSERVPVSPNDTKFTAIKKTTLNWVDANKKGMSFGIIFGGMFMAFLMLIIPFKQYFQMKGYRGAFVGMLIGLPLGICANCVAPVGAGMKKEGVGLSTALATMITSPTMNPVGLIILFSIFPIHIALLRFIIILFLILICVPFLSFFFTKNQQTPQKYSSVQYKKEPFFRSLQYVFGLCCKKIGTLLLVMVPLMLFAGFLGAVAVTYIPLEILNVTDISVGKHFSLICFTALLGAFLPVPIFADLVFSSVLLSSGASLPVITTLLIVLPSTSVFSFIVLRKYFSLEISASLFVVVLFLGVLGGSASLFF